MWILHRGLVFTDDSGHDIPLTIFLQGSNLAMLQFMMYAIFLIAV
jgi:hypothetical protein